MSVEYMSPVEYFMRKLAVELLISINFSHYLYHTCHLTVKTESVLWKLVKN